MKKTPTPKPGLGLEYSLDGGIHTRVSLFPFDDGSCLLELLTIREPAMTEHVTHLRLSDEALKAISQLAWEIKHGRRLSEADQ